MRARRWLGPFLVIIPTIMVAALGLGYLSYRAAAQLERMSEASVERSNRALGLKLIDRIEKVIIDGDRTFFRLVSLDDPREFRELWRRIVRISPAVESVIVLDDQGKVVHLIAKLSPSTLRYFRKIFVNQILPDMGLDRLPPDQHRHLHKKYQGVYYLMSYIRRRSEDRDYFIVLNVNLPYILEDIFQEEFKELQATNAIAVIDQEDERLLYGRPMQPDLVRSKLLFEGRFPTTLYKWRLQIAPLQMTSLRRGARARRLSNMVLVGTAVGVIWIGLVVVLVAMRKERRANELKSEFVSNVSHELKTPLSLIRMFGELLALGRVNDPETSKEYAEIITRESQRLTSQIDNVLDFARIERGKAAYDMREGDLRSVVERVGELCHYRCEQAGVQLQLDVPPEPVMAHYDESSMTLLLLNLVENALKYGGSAEGMIRVALVPWPTEITLTVVDEGPGIDGSEVDRIFDRFYRGKAARQGDQRGSGIGLSLVKHVAQAHGGDVSVRSAPGQGAAFAITLPVNPRKG